MLRMPESVVKDRPVWNVIYGDFNGRDIRVYNIFNHHRFYEDCVKAKRNFKEDKDGFAEEVRKSLMYFFWSKCEWEVIISHWPSKEGFRDEKIDVYDQVRLNWDQFINYLWENRKLLKAERKKKDGI